ncbi:MAG: 23S rRNA (pseudouridine(1915)-N(3))-methyltransferase RlmH [Clostridiales bacterium]|nr:23S rRNA (pseudouridine(1915)-N(3))-methyltransferase RlmH [Clostridiales bacterium]
MPVNVICVGKLRERFYAEAADEYLKRLRRLMPVTVIELPDEPEPSQPSDKANEAVMRREGERILQKIGAQDYVLALCIEGKQYASPELAERLEGLFTQGKSRVDFVIGGSLGLDKAVLGRADERMSMSRMTFPHQLARVMLLEQLFRAAKINAGERYHK